jgi:uncharacterized caspase-like protein
MPGLSATPLAADLPPGPRLALVIATSTYTDAGLRRLRAPAQDAADLAQVLSDPGIGGFTVTTVIDQPAQEIRVAVEDFLDGRGTSDLLVVYLSCHGLLDARGRLYFAATDTRKDRLGATGVGAAWVLDLLEHCRARRQILILDSCFSGAFASRAKGQADLGLGHRLLGQGRGRIVLTASAATEYSFEGEPTGAADPAGSVFTAALVQGLLTGDADTDHDGRISVDEAYGYVFDQVQAMGAAQTPQRWLYGGEGQIVLARNPARPASDNREAAAGPRLNQLVASPSYPARTLTRHAGPVLSVAFSPDGRLLATSSQDKTTRLWEPATGECLRTLTRHTGYIFRVAFSPVGQLLATASGDETVRLWDPATGDCLRTLSTVYTPIWGLAFSPDGQLLATCGGGKVRLWDLATSDCLPMSASIYPPTFSAAFSPDGKLLATASEDNPRLWDPATGDCLRTLTGHTGPVYDVAFSPGGRLLATASGDETVRLWDPATGDCLHILTGHTNWIWGVAFSLDGRLLATASFDETARVWNPATGDHVFTLTGHAAKVRDVAFSPDGTMLATCGDDETARVWRVSN